MISSFHKFGVIVVGLFFSIVASATPMLVFDSNPGYPNKALIGVDNVILGDHFYDVRFTYRAATIFTDQTQADAASNALIDQVFSLTSFKSLGFCGSSSSSCDENLVWFTNENRAGRPDTRVKQYWGEFSYDEQCSPISGHDCMRKINASYADFYGSADPYSSLTTAPWLIGCGNCGASGSVWTQRTEVPEPGSLMLLMISLSGLVLVRANRLNRSRTNRAI